MKNIFFLPYLPQVFRFLVVVVVLGFVPFSIQKQTRESYSSLRMSAAFWSVQHDSYTQGASWRFQSPVIEKLQPAVEAAVRDWLSDDTPATTEKGAMTE